MNAFRCHTVVLYYLWLLLLSVFIAIIRQQAFWQSQSAICHSPPWLKELERTLEATQYPKLQIVYGKNDAILLWETRSGGGGGQKGMKIWHYLQTLEARASEMKQECIIADPIPRTSKAACILSRNKGFFSSQQTTKLDMPKRVCFLEARSNSNSLIPI